MIIFFVSIGILFFSILHIKLLHLTYFKFIILLKYIEFII